MYYMGEKGTTRVTCTAYGEHDQAVHKNRGRNHKRKGADCREKADPRHCTRGGKEVHRGQCRIRLLSWVGKVKQCSAKHHHQ